MPTPNFTQQFNEIWGWPQEVGLDSAWYPTIAAAANFCFGSNPPFSYTDFIQFYPAFAGTQTSISGTSAASTISGVAANTNLAMGQYITGPGLDSGTTIAAISAGPAPFTITLSKPVLAAQATAVSFNVVTAPIVPTAVVNAFIALAVNSLYISRWGDTWQIAVCMFVAHYLTLWAQSQTASPNSNAAMLVASGLAQGIDIAQHAGDVSYSVKPVEIEGFGAWNLTSYGLQLATLAQVIGSVSSVIW